MLNIGDSVDGFCRQCKTTTNMRFDGSAVKGEIEPGFEKYSKNNQYTCLTCGFSYYGTNPPQKSN